MPFMRFLRQLLFNNSVPQEQRVYLDAIDDLREVRAKEFMARLERTEELRRHLRQTRRELEDLAEAKRKLEFHIMRNGLDFPDDLKH